MRISELYRSIFTFYYRGIFSYYFQLHKLQGIASEAGIDKLRSNAKVIIIRWLIISLFFILFLWCFIILGKHFIPASVNNKNIQILIMISGVVLGGLANYWVAHKSMIRMSQDKLQTIEGNIAAWSSTKRNIYTFLVFLAGLISWICAFVSLILTSMYISGYFDR